MTQSDKQTIQNFYNSLLARLEKAYDYLQDHKMDENQQRAYDNIWKDMNAMLFYLQSKNITYKFINDRISIF